jgi:hypothetical protein
MDVLKTIGWSLQTLRPSLGLVNSLTEDFFAVGVPFGLGSLLGSGCGGQNVLDNTKPMKINFRQNLRGLFIEGR